MGNVPISYQRSQPRTAALVIISIGVPALGVILGSIEIASGNYRFGTLLLILAVMSSFAIVVFLQLGSR